MILVAESYTSPKLPSGGSASAAGNYTFTITVTGSVRSSIKAAATAVVTVP